jgi:repressor LexA
MKFDNNLGNKEIFAKNLQRYMSEKNIDRRELSEKVNIPYSTLSDWINAKKYPRIDNIEILANYLKIDKSDLIEPPKIKIREDVKPLIKHTLRQISNKTAVPLIGTIAAGTPILAEQNIERYFDIDTSIHCDFCLKIEGNSMIEADIHNNDIVFIRQQPTLEIGEIGAFLIGEEATLKRFYRTEDSIILQPANVEHPPQVYGSDSEIKILGKLVATLHINN